MVGASAYVNVWVDGKRKEAFRINAPYVLCAVEGNRSWLDLNSLSTKPPQLSLLQVRRD
jgi:hypothetical protein